MDDTSNIRHSLWIKSRNAIWEQVLHLGQRRRYSKNTIIGGNGERVDCLQYLYRGRLKLSRINAEGNEKILFYIEKGNLFGEVPFWSGNPMDSTFTAVDNCEVYAFSRCCITEKIMRSYPEMVINLLEGMADKAHVISGQAADLASLLSRVSKVLIYVSEREAVSLTDTKVVYAKGISQQELASILGVHRVTLNHTIAYLKRQGIIEEMTKTALVILDYDRLLELAKK